MDHFYFHSAVFIFQVNNNFVMLVFDKIICIVLKHPRFEDKFSFALIEDYYDLIFVERVPGRLSPDYEVAGKVSFGDNTVERDVEDLLFELAPSLVIILFPNRASN